MSAPERLIRKYANRKLYDTYTSSYVTLEEVAQLIREGLRVTIKCNQTKCDITYRTLLQLLYEMERKTLGDKNTEMLESVIKSDNGTFAGYISQLQQTC